MEENGKSWPNIEQEDYKDGRIESKVSSSLIGKIGMVVDMSQITGRS
jgi:hypothetical protein